MSLFTTTVDLITVINVSLTQSLERFPPKISIIFISCNVICMCSDTPFCSICQIMTKDARENGMSVTGLLMAIFPEEEEGLELFVNLTKSCLWRVTGLYIIPPSTCFYRQADTCAVVGELYTVRETVYVSQRSHVNGVTPKEKHKWMFLFFSHRHVQYLNHLPGLGQGLSPP